VLSRRGKTPIQTVLLHMQQEPVPPSQRTDNAALDRLALAAD
jgi:hypothetical protein